MKVLIFSLLFPIIIFHKSSNESTGYIWISYTGDVGKPYPILVFDHLGKFDTTYLDTSIYGLFFVHIFQIDERDLLNIKQTILKRQVQFKTDTLSDPLAVRIDIDEEDTIILIKEREEISGLFKEIINQWREHDKTDLKRRLYQLSRRIGVPILAEKN